MLKFVMQILFIIFNEFLIMNYLNSSFVYILLYSILAQQMMVFLYVGGGGDKAKRNFSLQFDYSCLLFSAYISKIKGIVENLVASFFCHPSLCKVGNGVNIMICLLPPTKFLALFIVHLGQ